MFASIALACYVEKNEKGEKRESTAIASGERR
jgi:hypothetical protein